MQTDICKICGSGKTSITTIDGSKIKRCIACGEISPIQTNADRIRSMSDKELARFLMEVNSDEWPKPWHVKISDWLKQEVE